MRESFGALGRTYKGLRVAPIRGFAPEAISFPYLGDSLCGNLIINQIDGVLGHNDKIIANFENLLDWAGIFLLTLNKQLLIILAQTNESSLFNRGGPIIHHNGSIF